MTVTSPVVSNAAAAVPAGTLLNDVDRARAGLYGLLAALLGAPPAAATLDLLRGLDGDDSPLGAAMAAVVAAARMADPLMVEREYTNLFIGLGRGELVPYASFYRTGFLQEKPLAVLRDDLAGLGIVAAPDRAEPEDHIATVLEVMGGLIDGSFGPTSDAEADIGRQRIFFTAHVAPWAGRFFRDLETAGSAGFYRPVGRLGRQFVEIETEAFTLP